MDSSSGLKECPRCGLRNRRGAYQCDFCGWDFKAASDDWMGKISDLEKIGRDVEVGDIDRSTRSMIELTMKKPAEAPPKEKKPEKQLEVPVPLTLEDQGEVVAEAVAEVLPVEQEVETSSTESEVAALVFSPAMEARPEPAPLPKVEEVSTIRSRTVSETDDRSLTVPVSMIGLGVILYATVIFLTTSNTIGRAEGWAIAIVASAMIAFAVIRALPKLRNKESKEKEIILCPVCHEVVTETETKCPSCGVKFKETSLRE